MHKTLWEELNEFIDGAKIVNDSIGCVIINYTATCMNVEGMGLRNNNKWYPLSKEHILMQSEGKDFYFFKSDGDALKFLGESFHDETFPQESGWMVLNVNKSMIDTIRKKLGLYEGV